MATVGFRLRSKLNKNVAIKVYLSLGRNNMIEMNTGFSINPNNWSSKTNLPIQNDTENKRIFNNLKKLESYIFVSLNDASTRGVIVDKHWLRKKIDECFDRVKKEDEGLLLNRIQFIIEHASTRKVRGRKRLGLSESRVKSYITFKNLISRYEEVIKKNIHLLDINKMFVDQFVNWLVHEQAYSMNYAGKQVDNLKTVCLDAENLEIPVHQYVHQIQSFSESDEERYIVTLSFEELETIENLGINNESLNNARNWILLGCAIGQRGADLLNIAQSNLRRKDGTLLLDVYQSKTEKWVTVPILSDYLVDLLENSFPYKISTQKLNNYIKEVCRLAEIDTLCDGKKFDKDSKRKVFGKYPKYELITTHCFRRSFATNYYRKIPTPILIGITGHARESFFLSYINKREDKDSNAMLFSSYYKGAHLGG